MKKKRNKKKPKMTDIDLMNNFMKSLLSHPEEDAPVLKNQASTQSAQNNQNPNQAKRRPQHDKQKKHPQEEVKTESIPADLREDFKRTPASQPQQVDNKAPAASKPKLTQVMVMDPESPIFVKKTPKHQNASRSAQRRYTEDNASMLLTSSHGQDDHNCAQSHQDEVSEKPLQKNKKKGPGQSSNKSS